MARDDAPLTRVDVEQITGPLDDAQAAAILAIQPTTETLHEAVAFANAESDAMGDAEIPLSGKSARVYEILTAGDGWEPDER